MPRYQLRTLLILLAVGPPMLAGKLDAHVKQTVMKRSTAMCWAFAIFGAVLILPVCGFVLNCQPEIVFYFGVTAFTISVMGPIWLRTARSMPPAGSPPVAKRLYFTIRDLLCLTTVLFGITMFTVSAFRCEAAERASRPGPVSAVVFRRFVWELECGLACITIGGLIWFRSASEIPQ